jgi:SAM-dependent methyltransferase
VWDSELKARHRSIWASGDYPDMVETFLFPLGPALVEACGIGSGNVILDVAAGTGNASIRAAKAGAQVTASDLTPELLDAGRARAESEGLTLNWVEADAEHLPFEDESFDVVISSIGVMFAPHHQDAANELVRVCRPAGTIGLLSWTPEGMIGALFGTVGSFAPAPVKLSHSTGSFHMRHPRKIRKLRKIRFLRNRRSPLTCGQAETIERFGYCERRLGFARDFAAGAFVVLRAFGLLADLLPSRLRTASRLACSALIKSGAGLSGAGAGSAAVIFLPFAFCSISARTA